MIRVTCSTFNAVLGDQPRCLGNRGTLNYLIDNNTVTNTASSTIPAPHDGFTFTFHQRDEAV